MHAALVPADEVDDFIIVRAVLFTSRVQRDMARDVLRAENLPVLEWRLLFCVARFGSCHLAYITRRTSIDPAHGSRAAAALERKGLISRCDDPQNRRRKLISLTPEGRALFDRVWPQALGKIRDITEVLSGEEMNTLKTLLDKLNKATEPLLDPAEKSQGLEDKSTIAAQ